MSTAETFALLEAAQSGDEEAGERVLRENTGLIWSVVRRYNGRGVETEDLYQLGCIGFLKAVKGFDLTYGTQFSTYAVPKIAGEIRRFLRDDGAIKVSRTLRERSQSIYSAREKLRVQLGREPVLSELAEETGLSVEEIADADLASAAPESFQQEMGDGLTLETLLGTESPEESLIEQLSLRAAIDLLPGAGAHDDPAALFQGADAGADGAGAWRVAGAGIAAGASGAAKAAHGDGDGGIASGSD